MAIIAFKLNLGPTPGRHGPRKTDRVHPEEDGLHDLIATGPRRCRAPNMAADRRLEPRPDADPDLDQGAGFRIQGPDLLDRSRHLIVGLGDLRVSGDNLLIYIRQRLAHRDFPSC